MKDPEYFTPGSSEIKVGYDVGSYCCMERGMEERESLIKERAERKERV